MEYSEFPQILRGEIYFWARVGEKKLLTSPDILYAKHHNHQERGNTLAGYKGAI